MKKKNLIQVTGSCSVNRALDNFPFTQHSCVLVHKDDPAPHHSERKYSGPVSFFIPEDGGWKRFAPRDKVRKSYEEGGRQISGGVTSTSFNHVSNLAPTAGVVVGSGRGGSANYAVHATC